jgi:hypothetical protein
MALIHNCLLRGLNGIYPQVPYGKNPTGVKDFLFFCYIWAKPTNNHHDTEEQHIFPAVDAFTKKPNLMDKDREQR